MIDAWLCRRYPGGLPVGVTQDTRRNRSVPGETHSRDTCRIRRLPVKLHSLDSRRTRGLPGGSYVLGYSGHVAHSGSIQDSPGETPGVRSRDTWRAQKVSGRGGFTLRHSGTRGSLATLPGIYSRDTWLSYRRYSGGGSRCELREHVALPEGKSEGVSTEASKGLSAGFGTRGVLRRAP